MSADTITFVRPADGRITLAKIIRVEGGKFVGKGPSAQVKTFEFAELPVRDLGTLYVTVKRHGCSRRDRATRQA